MFKTKLFLAVALVLLTSSGIAVAASGNIPDSVTKFFDESAGSDQYLPEDDLEGASDDQDSGGGVSAIAKDKSVIGTKTLPNGKVIENHGLAVSEAAKAQKDDKSNDGQSQAPGQNGEGDEEQLTNQESPEEEIETAPSQNPNASAKQGNQRGRP